MTAVMSKTKLSNNKVINRSYAYALPMIALPHNLKLDDLVNCLGVYIFHEGHPDLSDRIYLHFSLYDGSKVHKQVLELLGMSKHLDFTEYPDSFTVLFCFKSKRLPHGDGHKRNLIRIANTMVAQLIS